MAIKNIQGLRAVAVCLVLFAHIYGVLYKVVAPSRALDIVMALGHTGVDLFFVISGFIMITVHWTNFGDRGITKTFLVKRVVRIVPLYWLLTLSLALLFFIAPQLAHTWPQSNVLSSLLIVPMDAQPLLFVGWTLIYEMYFYYVFAVLLNFSRRRAFLGLGVWAALILLAQLWPGRNLNCFTQQYLGTLVLEFLFGVVVGSLVKQGIARYAIATIAAGVLALAASLTYVIAANISYADGWDARFFFYGLPMALVLYGFVVLERERRFVMPTFTQRIGDASYSIYLWHTILYAIAGRFVVIIAQRMHVPWPPLLLLPIAVVLASMVLYHCIEVPLLRISRNFSARFFPVPAAAA